MRPYKIGFFADSGIKQNDHTVFLMSDLLDVKIFLTIDSAGFLATPEDSKEGITRSRSGKPYIVRSELAICGHHDETAGLGLSDQHAVEGVAVVKRQRA